jgi:putative tryptophan/tyrosine transport system substrate-binding protein
LWSGALGEIRTPYPQIRKGLSDSGYVEGQNVAIEYRWAEGGYDRLPALAAELVRRQVAVLVASSTPALAAAKAATATIPIVFNTGADPVAAGFVASLNRPGGNLTGVTILLTQVVAKQFELLREVIPKAGIIGFMHNPTNRTFAESVITDAREAARRLGFKLQVLEASTERGIDDAFSNVVQLQLDAYVGRILKGEKPADPPVQQSTKVELFVNLKTAKALGLTVPLPLLGRADGVIE